MHESADTTAGETRKLIADIRETPLDEVLAPGDSVLSTVLRLVLEQVEKPGENYAAHGSSP